MKNSLRIHKWTHNEFNIFILGVLTHPHYFRISKYVGCPVRCSEKQMLKPPIKLLI